MALGEVCDMLHAECSSLIAEVVLFFFFFLFSENAWRAETFSASKTIMFIDLNLNLLSFNLKKMSLARSFP